MTIQDSDRSLSECFAREQNNFNLIRLTAALLVIYGHAAAVTGHGPPDVFLEWVGYKFIGGVAVDVFFVISGFLVVASATSERGLRYYLASRALRIFPGLFVCVALTVFVLGPGLTTEPDYFRQTQTWAYLLNNISAYSTEYFLPGVFQELHDHAVNGSLWSLPVEVRLYLLVFLATASGVLRRRSLSNIALLGVLVTGELRPDTWAFVFEFENHRHVAAMFILGAFAWLNREAIPVSATILLLLLCFAGTQRGSPSFGVAYSLLIAYAVFFLAYLPGLGWFNRVGDYSYGVYLYGWPSQQLMIRSFPGLDNTGLTVLSCCLALVCAVASWHLVEAPALKWRRWLAAARAK